MTHINVVQNDVGYDINFTLKDANDVAVDLSGGSLLFKVQRQGESALKFSGAMSIVLAASGTCKYTVAAADFDAVGDYYAEVQVTISSKVITFSDIVVHVKPEIPR